MDTCIDPPFCNWWLPRLQLRQFLDDFGQHRSTILRVWRIHYSLAIQLSAEIPLLVECRWSYPTLWVEILIYMKGSGWKWAAKPSYGPWNRISCWSREAKLRWLSCFRSWCAQDAISQQQLNRYWTEASPRHDRGGLAGPTFGQADEELWLCALPISTLRFSSVCTRPCFEATPITRSNLCLRSDFPDETHHVWQMRLLAAIGPR